MPLTCKTLFLCYAAVAPFSMCASINIDVDAVQKSVVFLYAADAKGAVDPAKPVGTGFLVEVPLASDPKHAYRVLVTARHVFDPEWAGCSQNDPDVIYARLNKKSYNPESDATGVDFVRLELTSEGNPLWRHHKDAHIDAAVLLLKISLDAFDTASIPIALVPTEQELSSQSIGDPIMSAGLMPALARSRRNYPIFKFGQISNIPHEDIETSCAPDRPKFLVKVWLVAANLVPGNSGSPYASEELQG